MSLFAQHLGTAEPVSLQRIQKTLRGRLTLRVTAPVTGRNLDPRALARAHTVTVRNRRGDG